jgi:PAS domain S-box-containing protein
MHRSKLIISKHKTTRSMLIPNRLLIGLVTFTTIGLIIGAVLFYNTQAQAIHERKADELKSISALKVQQITQWRQERLTDAQMNSASPYFDQAIYQWLSNPGDATIKTMLLNRLQMIVDLEGYQNVFLATADGSLLLSLDMGLASLDAETRQLVTQVSATQEIILGDLIRNPVSGKVYLNVAAPIPGDQNLPAAVLILQVDPEKYLFPLIQSWPIPSRSAETILIHREGGETLFLNTLRFNPAPPLTLRIPLTQTNIPAVQAALGQSGEFEGLDYRGVKVLAEMVPVPGTNWVMVAKVDREEIFSEIRSLGLVVILIVTLAILMTIAIAAYHFNRRQRGLYQHLLQAEQERRKAQDEIRTTLYSIGDGVITTDCKGRITRLNPVAEQLTGWRENEAQGRPLEDVFPISNEITRANIENPVGRVLREGVIIGLTNHTVLVARDGTVRPIADSGAPIRDEKNVITGVVLVFRDQTEERAAQREHALLTYTMAKSLNEIYLFDADTFRFRFANEGAVENLGYSQEQLRSMTPIDIMPEFTLESFQSLVIPLEKDQTATLVFETVQRRANGSRYPVEVHLQLFEYGGERVFLAMVNDITKYRQAEKTLQESESRLVQAQTIAQVGNWELNLADNTLWASAEAFRIYGGERTSPYLPLEQVQQYLVPGDRPRLDAALHALTRGQGQYDIEFRIQRENEDSQRVIHSIAHLVCDNNGTPTKVIGVIQDITERKRAEGALKESETRFRTLFDHAAVGVALLETKTGCYIDINQRYCDFLGYTKAEMLNMTFQTVSHPDDVQENIEKNQLLLFGKIGEFTIEKRYIRKDGSIVWGELTASPLWVPGEELSDYLHIAVVQDITERKRVEIKLAEQLEELRRWHTVTLGREMRILELKEEVNETLVQAGLPPRYACKGDGSCP